MQRGQLFNRRVNNGKSILNETYAKIGGLDERNSLNKFYFREDTLKGCRLCLNILYIVAGVRGKYGVGDGEKCTINIQP